MTGFFDEYNGSPTAFNFTRINQNGSLNNSFNTNLGSGVNGGTIWNFVTQSDAAIWVLGQYLNINGSTDGAIVRLNSDGTLDIEAQPGTFLGLDNVVRAFAVQPDGSVLITWDFISINSDNSSHHFTRLFPDGMVDDAFNMNLGAGAIDAFEVITLQSDGKILLGNGNTPVLFDGSPVNGVIRLNMDGTVNNGFNVGSGFTYLSSPGVINAIVERSDGQLVIGGQFDDYKGNAANNIIQLNPDGSVDHTFGTGADNPVNTIALRSDDGIIAGGDFTIFDGTSVNYLVRANPGGAVNNTFVTNMGSGPNGLMDHVLILNNDKILITGNFNSFNGNPANGAARLAANGTFDANFDIGLGPELGLSPGFINSAVEDNQNRILVVGEFDMLDGNPVTSFVRLNSNGSHNQSYSVTLKGGSSFPQVADVHFENPTYIVGNFFEANGEIRTGIAKFFNTQSEIDSMALVALYQTTDGDNWTDNSNWLSGDLDTWFGVTVSGGAVTNLDLTENNLVDTIPFEILAMNDLDELRLNRNDLTALPDMSSMSNLSNVRVVNNRLGFESIEPNIGISDFRYDPQDSITLDLDTLVVLGDSVTFDAITALANNSYQWYKDTVALTDDTLQTLTLTDLDFSDIGIYTCEITNSVVTDLTLYTGQFRLSVGARIRGTVLDQDGSPVTPVRVRAFKVTAGAYDTLRFEDAGGTLRDYVTVDNNGDYDMKDVELAEYVLLAEARGGQADDFFTTYFINEEFWDETDTLVHRGDTTGVDITLVAVPTPTTGPGVVMGVLEEEFDDGGRLERRRRVRRGRVRLRRARVSGRELQEEFDIAADTETDDDGAFEFTDLLVGDYNIKIDIPGVPMDEELDLDFFVGPNTPVELEAVIEDGMITINNITEEAGVTGIFAKDFGYLEIYPNPAGDKIQLVLENLNLRDFRITLTDLTGRVMFSENIEGVAALREQVEMDINHLNQGVYILNIFDMANLKTAVKSARLLVNR